MPLKESHAKLAALTVLAASFAFLLILAVGHVLTTGGGAGQEISESGAPIPYGRNTLLADLSGSDLTGADQTLQPTSFSKRKPENALPSLSTIENGQGIVFSLAGLKAPEVSSDRLPAGPSRLLHPSSRRTLAGMPVTPSEDASLGSLALTSDGNEISLTPAFDPETTCYEATVDAASVDFAATRGQDAAGIMAVTVGGRTNTLNSPKASISSAASLTEAATTTISVTVQAVDGVTIRTYRVVITRPAAPAVPNVTIEDSPGRYATGLGLPDSTSTGSGPVTHDLQLTVDPGQRQPWLDDTTFTAPIAPGVS